MAYCEAAGSVCGIFARFWSFWDADFRFDKTDPPRLPGESSQASWPRSEVGSEFRSWPESLTISPASGEDSGPIARREVGARTGSKTLVLTTTN